MSAMPDRNESWASISTLAYAAAEAQGRVPLLPIAISEPGCAIDQPGVALYPSLYTFYTDPCSSIDPRETPV
jgi:hypothetical protein